MHQFPGARRECLPRLQHHTHKLYNRDHMHQDLLYTRCTPSIPLTSSMSSTRPARSCQWSLIGRSYSFMPTFLPLRQLQQTINQRFQMRIPVSSFRLRINQRLQTGLIAHMCLGLRHVYMRYLLQAMLRQTVHTTSSIFNEFPTLILYLRLPHYLARDCHLLQLYPPSTTRLLRQEGDHR